MAEQTLINNGFTKDTYINETGNSGGIVGISYGNTTQAVTFNNIRKQTFSSGRAPYQSGISNDLSYKSITFRMATFTSIDTNVGGLYSTISKDVEYWVKTVETPGTETINYWVKSVENVPPTSSNYYW